MSEELRRYEPIARSDESTVVAEFVAEGVREIRYQSEAELERDFIARLQTQAYDYLPITSEAQLVANLRRQLAALNGITFSDAEWQRFFDTCIAGANDGIVEKTARVQEDHVQLLRRDDGTIKNVYLIDKRNIHNNRLQVINQYEVEGARAIGFTLGTPGVGMVGVVEDLLVDRAFIPERNTSAAELCSIADLPSPAPHMIANALAAAALARAHGISQQAVRDGLRGFRLDGHRIQTVATIEGVTWVDDSKATNPHAAESSLRGFDPVVWVELIPVQETRTYVKRVLGNYLVYRARLGQDELGIKNALRKIPS